jgi:gamma-glutamylputrescine oxidase
MPFSFWEYNQYQKDNTYVVIGGGIVGLSSAIELKKLNERFNVIVIDEFYPAQGASTKNAGFACFGSVTEIIDDLSHMDRNEVIDIVKMRWNGISILKERLHENDVNIDFNGGKELFAHRSFPSKSNINLANSIMQEATQIPDYFKVALNADFSQLDEQVICMKAEGELNPIEMNNVLQSICRKLGVQFIYGRKAILNEQQKTVEIEGNIIIKFDKVIVCTNGFTKKILPHIDVNPARNHILVTEPLPQLKWKGVYHYDKGYYYFRRVDDRILLGGARNFDSEKENTSSFEFNPKIIDELKRFLFEIILCNQKCAIDYHWTGILGISKSKFPIMAEYEKDCYLAVRLGGMGVAIGSYLGRQVVNLAFKN